MKKKKNDNMAHNKCKICGSSKISKFIGICIDCIRKGNKEAKQIIEDAYRKSRLNLNLPISPPKSRDGIPCVLCEHKCIIGENEISFCGIRRNENGKLIGPTKTRAYLHAYFDLNPTNCCAAWFCPAATGCGYPKYSYYEGGENNTYNYSVFFYGCSFNCLYCQNSSHKTELNSAFLYNSTKIENAEIMALKPKTSCICYFGGSPEPHFPFALNLSNRVLKKAKSQNRIMRICWEWNGCGNPILVEKAAKISLKSGGIVKFDLKAFDPLVARALIGVEENILKRVYENFKLVSKYIEHRPEIPLLTAVTLLVPYYIDEQEVEKIAKFIANINDEIPYSLLIFHPCFYLVDLPVTPLEQVKKCYEKAKKHLKNINVGNLHLLGLRRDYFDN
ncbi:MAG: radical SAM protein [Promethearchaeota archaeon]